MIRVNAPTSGVDFNAPFGGAKESSYGPREQGQAARAFYTESRTVLISPLTPLIEPARAAPRPVDVPMGSPERPFWYIHDAGDQPAGRGMPSV